jgi:hypothetical protein
MKLAPREARAGMKPAEASLIAAWCSAAPRMLSVRTYRRPDWAAADSRSPRYSISSIIGASDVVRMRTGRGHAKIGPDPSEQACCGEVCGG